MNLYFVSVTYLVLTSRKTPTTFLPYFKKFSASLFYFRLQSICIFSPVKMHRYINVSGAKKIFWWRLQEFIWETREPFHYIYIYIYIYIYTQLKGIQSKYRKLVWVGFVPTTTEFRWDDVTGNRLSYQVMSATCIQGQLCTDSPILLFVQSQISFWLLTSSVATFTLIEIFLR